MRPGEPAAAVAGGKRRVGCQAQSCARGNAPGFRGSGGLRGPALGLLPAARLFPAHGSLTPTPPAGCGPAWAPDAWPAGCFRGSGWKSRSLGGDSTSTGCSRGRTPAGRVAGGGSASCRSSVCATPAQDGDVSPGCSHSHTAKGAAACGPRACPSGRAAGRCWESSFRGIP